MEKEGEMPLFWGNKERFDPENTQTLLKPPSKYEGHCW